MAEVASVSVMSETTSFYKYAAATQGFLLWGGWGFYVNSKISIRFGISAGLVQGIFSFVATLVVVYFLTKLFNYFDRFLFKMTLPTCLMLAALFSFSVFAHTVAQTPEILKTILPNLVVSGLFCFFTTYKLVNAKTR